MKENLLEISTKELLTKFGVGNHKPGSGSAAAFQGLLSSQLIRTVIKLTNDPKRRQHYAEVLSDFLSIDEHIDRVVYPALEKIFIEDSQQFDRVIEVRQAAEAETDGAKKKLLETRAQNELKPATEMPAQIAEHGVYLADAAMKVFEYGFRSARGDSGAAITAALSSVSGSLSIIDLNLLYFKGCDWAVAMRAKTDLLRGKLKQTRVVAETKLLALQDESERKHNFYVDVNNLLKRKTRSGLTEPEIEGMAIELQRLIWLNRDVLWRRNPPDDPFEIINPMKVFDILDYRVERVTTLGQHQVFGTIVEVAGEIDQTEKRVSISEQFQRPTQNFTIAHELGHFMLHNQVVMHRDRPLDGPSDSLTLDPEESQADKFAVYFLMPRKLVIKIFKRFFLAEQFQINDETAFALNERSSEDLHKKCRSKRALATMLASTENYNGARFASLANQFQVSTKAMAIRLEELDLIQYNRA